MKNYTNIGVQLMPLIMVFASIGFYALNANVHSVACLVIAIVMWMACFPENR